MRIAFLGLGRMGREMVRHVIAAGHDVTVWNRSPEATRDPVAQGARAAGSVAEAVATAEVVVTMFFGPDVSRETITGPQVPFAPDALWLDATTIGPADAAELEAWAAGHGVRYVHAPVIGSVGPAHEGMLTTLVGGAPRDTAAVRPLVELWADPERVRVLGSPRLAAVGKLVANLGLTVVAEGILESLRLGRAGGLSTAEVFDLLSVTQLATQAGLKRRAVEAQEWTPAQFSVDALLKDTGFMTALADRPLPAVEAFRALLLAARDDGLGDADYIAAVRDDV